MKLLCMGEGLVDVITSADGEVTERAGGSIFNVACGAARLGLNTSLASWWGRDSRGQLLTQAAQAAGVAVIEGSTGATVTSVAHASLDAQGKATYEFDLSWDLPPLFDLQEYGHLHIGSYSALLAEGAAKIWRVLDSRAPDTTVSYDPNLRPALVSDFAATKVQVETLVKNTDIVKVSDEDLDFLYPGAHRAEIVKQWIGGYWELRTGGPQLIVVTRGGKGAELYTPWLPAPLQLAPSLPGSLVDTVGAGDSFMAGLLAGLADNNAIGLGRTALNSLDQEELAEILYLASRTAGVTVTHAGAYAPARRELS